MTDLTLISSRKQPSKPSVEVALHNELGLLLAADQGTEQNIKAFEFQHGMTSEGLLKLYVNNDETFDFAEWIGEY